MLYFTPGSATFSTQLVSLSSVLIATNSTGFAIANISTSLDKLTIGHDLSVTKSTGVCARTLLRGNF